MSASVDQALERRPNEAFPLLNVLEPDGALRSRRWVQAIDRAWRSGAPGVFFAAPGFERRADFGGLVAHAVGRGLDTGWVSDGRVFEDAGYAQKLVERARLRCVHLRDRQGDVQRLERVEALLVAQGVEVWVSRELSSLTVSELDAALERTSEAYWTWNPEETDGPSPEELAALIRDKSGALPGRVVGLPLCLSAAGNAASRVFNEAQAFDGLDGLKSERVLPPACAGCARDMTCPGLPAAWFRDHGHDALVPFAPVDEARPWAPIPAGEISAFRPTERTRLDVAPRYPDTALITLMVAGCDLSCIFFQLVSH